MRVNWVEGAQCLVMEGKLAGLQTDWGSLPLQDPLIAVEVAVTRSPAQASPASNAWVIKDMCTLPHLSPCYCRQTYNLMACDTVVGCDW